MSVDKLYEELHALININENKAVDLKITPSLITGTILGEPVSDTGYRPMYFPDHMPDYKNWQAGFRVGTMNKGRNINVDGSLSIEKGCLYYIPAKPYSFTALRYSSKDECWENFGSWSCNAYSRITNAEYEELMRCTRAVSENEALKIIKGDSEGAYSIVSNFEHFFKSIGETDREKVALQMFKIIKQYL